MVRHICIIGGGIRHSLQAGSGVQQSTGLNEPLPQSSSDEYRDPTVASTSAIASATACSAFAARSTLPACSALAAACAQPKSAGFAVFAVTRHIYTLFP